LFHGSLAFSDCGRFLAGVGKDERNRTLVVVWDISLAPLALRRSVRIPIVAKQISEFEVRRIRFSPYDPMQVRLATRFILEYYILLFSVGSVGSVAKHVCTH
jgi:hypothetical protein